MKDYFAIIGVATAITAAAGVVAWNALSEAGKSNDGAPVVAAAAAAPQPISIPVSELPEANSETLKHALAMRGQEAEEPKPVITIEEIDPKDQKQSIKARLEQAKAEAAKQSEAKKRKLEKAVEKRQADRKKKAAERKAKDKKTAGQKMAEMKKAEMEKAKKEKAGMKKAEMEKAKKKKAKADKATEMAKAKKGKDPKATQVTKKEKVEKSLSKSIEEMHSDPSSPAKDVDDPGKIVFESRPEPFPTRPENLKIPEPMQLINANSTLLTKIVNSKSGPSPEDLHGTWEIMPCHSSVGVIATRSFKAEGMEPGSGPYYEIVQFYSDPERKVFSPRTETTVYVSLDEKHMLAAVNANTNLPKFSVLRKVSSEIQNSDEPEGEMSDADLPEDDFPIEEGEIVSIQTDQKSDKETKKKQSKKTGNGQANKSDESMDSDSVMKKKSDGKMKKSQGSAKKGSKNESVSKKPAKEKTKTSKQNPQKSPSTEQKKLTAGSKSKI